MDKAIDHLISLSGNEHRYQYFILFLTFLLWINTSFMAISIPFQGKPPEVVYINHKGVEMRGPITYDICDNYNFTLVAQPHSSFIYDFNIYCDRIKTGLIGTFVFIGDSSGAFLFPFITKLLSHKPNIIMSTAAYSLTLLVCIFFQNYWTIMITIIFSGIVAGFSSYSSLVLVEEVASISKRSVFGSVVNIGFAFSGICSAFLFYYFNNWLKVFAFLSISIVIIGMFFLLFAFDSPRAFIANKNKKRTIEILKGIAAFNNLQSQFEKQVALPENEQIINDIMQNNITDGEEELTVNEPTKTATPKKLTIKTASLNNKLTSSKTKNKKETITPMSLIKYSSVRTKFIILCLLWLLTNGVYNGISISAKFMPGNMYYNIMILYLMEGISFGITGNLINIPILGRKKTLFSMYMISIICLLLIYLIEPKEQHQFILNLIVRFCVAGVYTSFYTFSLENYPTELRNIGFGINATCGNIGGMIVPMIVEQIQQKTMRVYYSMILFFCSLMLLFGLKETVGLPMQENIDEIGE